MEQPKEELEAPEAPKSAAKDCASRPLGEKPEIPSSAKEESEVPEIEVQGPKVVGASPDQPKEQSLERLKNFSTEHLVEDKSLFKALGPVWQCASPPLGGPK